MTQVGFKPTSMWIIYHTIFDIRIRFSILHNKWDQFKLEKKQILFKKYQININLLGETAEAVDTRSIHNILSYWVCIRCYILLITWHKIELVYIYKLKIIIVWGGAGNID